MSKMEKGNGDHPATLVLTVIEVAQLLRISRNTCYDLVHEGRIPSVRLGRRVLIPRQGLEEWIAREAGLPPSPPAWYGGQPLRH